MRLKPLLSRGMDWLRFAAPTLLVAAFTRLPRPRRSATENPRILVTRLDMIGDFLLTTPFLRELRSAFPKSRITLLVRSGTAPLAKACPYVNEVLVLRSFKTREHFSTYLQYLRGAFAYLSYLRKFAREQLAGRIDLAIQPRWDVDVDWANLITHLSGAPRTIAWTEKTSPEKAVCNAGHNLLFSDVLPPGPVQHEIDRPLDIVRYLGGTVTSRLPEVWWTPEDEAAADRFFDEHPGHAFAAFGIGASHARRHWPFFGELLPLLLRNMDFVPILLAGPGEEDRAQAIAAHCPSTIVLHNMPLGAVAAVLSRCTFFVGNDSGPMHLAAAARIPVVEVSCHPQGGARGHVNSPERTGPVAFQTAVVRPRAASVECRNACLANRPHCIADILPAQVEDAVRSLPGAGMPVPTAKAVC